MTDLLNNAIYTNKVFVLKTGSAKLSAGNEALENVVAKYTMAVTVMLTGVPAHKIRKYEEAGLCKPARTVSKQRLYTDDDIILIHAIANLEEDGVNLAGIKIILGMQKEEKPKKVKRQKAKVKI